MTATQVVAAAGRWPLIPSGGVSVGGVFTVTSTTTPDILTGSSHQVYSSTSTGYIRIMFLDASVSVLLVAASLGLTKGKNAAYFNANQGRYSADIVSWVQVVLLASSLTDRFAGKVLARRIGTFISRTIGPYKYGNISIAEW